MGKFSNFENFAADSKMFENFPAYLNFIFLKKFPPFQRCGSHMLCVAHIQYAPLIFWLSVAHNSICATHIPGRGQASRAHMLSMAHFL
jgi:hypothetical protein